MVDNDTCLTGFPPPLTEYTLEPSLLKIKSFCALLNVRVATYAVDDDKSNPVLMEYSYTSDKSRPSNANNLVPSELNAIPVTTEFPTLRLVNFHYRLLCLINQKQLANIQIFYHL